MERHLLIKGITYILVLCALPLAKADTDCREVTVESKVVQATKVEALCFLKDTNYFISQDCKSLDCQFMGKLKNLQISFSFKDRPGAKLCKDLGGAVEKVKFSGSDTIISRCVFSDDQTSISLNLLESWNGKSFAGPGPSTTF